MLIKTFFLVAQMAMVILVNGAQESKRRFSRTIGGIPIIDMSPYAYHVAVWVNDNYQCGGVIVSRKNVLTAAHCLQKIDASNVTIRSGSPARDFYVEIYKVKNFTNHPYYSLNKLNNSIFDIAVIRVAEPIVYNYATEKIELFDHKEKAQPGEIGLVTGWSLDKTGSLSNFLTYVEIPIIKKSDCNNLYKKFGGIHDGEMCAGTGNGTGSWHGDSGGPLVVKKRLAGIVAYGEGKDVPEYPGVFSEIAYFRKWIDRYVEYDL